MQPIISPIRITFFLPLVLSCIVFLFLRFAYFYADFTMRIKSPVISYLRDNRILILSKIPEERREVLFNNKSQSLILYVNGFPEERFRRSKEEKILARI